jgi:hypothetical protein
MKKILLLLFVLSLIISPVLAYSEVFIRTGDLYEIKGYTNLNQTSYNVSNLGINDVYIPYETNRTDFVINSPESGYVWASDPNISISQHTGVTFRPWPLLRYTVFATYYQWDKLYNRTGTIYFTSEEVTTQFDYGLDPAYFTNLLPTPTPTPSPTPTPTPTPTPFIPSYPNTPDLHVMNQSEMVDKYDGFFINLISTTAPYMLERSIYDSKEWWVNLGLEPISYSGFHYYQGEYNSFSGYPDNAPYTIVHTHISPTANKHLSTDDYYGSGGSGIFNNSIYRMVEIDSTGISIFTRNDSQEDRYSVVLS